MLASAPYVNEYRRSTYVLIDLFEVIQQMRHGKTSLIMHALMRTMFLVMASEILLRQQCSFCTVILVGSVYEAV